MDSINHQLSYVAWLALPIDTRKKLVALFGIPKTGESVVHVGNMVDGRVHAEQTSDGYTPQDLSVITLQKMQELTGSKSDNFYTLFGQVVKDIDEYVETDDQFTDADIAPGLGQAPIPEVVEQVKKLPAKGGKHAKATKKATSK